LLWSENEILHVQLYIWTKLLTKIDKYQFFIMYSQMATTLHTKNKPKFYKRLQKNDHA